MNYVMSTALFREEILPCIESSHLLPERIMQPVVARNHSLFGTFLFGPPRAWPVHAVHVCTWL